MAAFQMHDRRLPQIDMVKGWAILGVTLIHSWALADSRWMTFLFYHSVPIFLVLFGVNSESWFERRSPEGRVADWYIRAFKRILIPAWATALVWWLMVAILSPPDPMVRITLGLPFWHLIGWFKQIGASWFVSLILQFVILFPAFYWVRRKFGFAVLLALAFSLTLPVTMYPLEIKKALTDSGWLIFAPRFALHIAFGMWLADRVDAIGWRSIAAAALVLVPLYTIEDRIWLLEWWRVADRLIELPLTVLLLAMMSGLAGIAAIARPLSWLGQHSWGLYLGQILTHNAFLYRFGGACNLYGCVGGVFENFNLWLYTGILLSGSIFFVLFGGWLVEQNQRLRAAGWPLLDLDL